MRGARGDFFFPFSTFNFYCPHALHDSSILQASSLSETPHSEKQRLCRVPLGGKNNTLECHGGLL